MIPAIKEKNQIGDLQDNEVEFGEQLYGEPYINVRCEHNFGQSLGSLQGTLYCTNYKIILKPNQHHELTLN